MSVVSVLVLVSSRHDGHRFNVCSHPTTTTTTKERNNTPNEEHHVRHEKSHTRRLFLPRKQKGKVRKPTCKTRTARRRKSRPTRRGKSSDHWLSSLMPHRSADFVRYTFGIRIHSIHIDIHGQCHNHSNQATVAKRIVHQRLQ